jgi:diacylglycerol kinase (ATP)
MEKTKQDKTLLVFNPTAGALEESPNELVEALAALQKVDIIPRVYLVNPGIVLEDIEREEIREGTKLVIVHGGDGTIDRVASGMVGTRAALGIIPSGTQNNIARSLEIPLGDVGEAANIIHEGNQVQSDMGVVRCGDRSCYFLETGSVGLIPELFPAADDIQHGNLARLGDLLASLFTSAPSKMRLNLDRGRLKLEATGHMLLVANMPYFGLQFHPAAHISCQDGLLDVVVYSNLTKLDLLGYVVLAPGSLSGDSRVLHFQVKSITVETEPKMQIMADDKILGEGTFSVTVKPACLNVMAPRK